ncbi:virulence factor BrkB family protein [Bradyrhizobium elkanii USDA 61]|nr:virulence factor BrkB family protein [Bradyrhizobium elkanii USDA 61]
MPFEAAPYRKFNWRTFPTTVLYSAGRKVRPVATRRAKWPGKHRRSWKCRSAWKSTCICAQPASKRQRPIHV